MHSRCFCPPERFSPPWSSRASRPPGHFFNKFMGAGSAAGSPQLFLRSLGVSPRGDSPGQFRKTAHFSAGQCRWRPAGKPAGIPRTSCPPHQNASGAYIVEPGDQLNQGAFGRAGAADNADGLTRKEFQTHLGQSRPGGAGAVLKLHVPEFYLAVFHGFQSSRHIGQIRLLRQHLADPGDAGQRAGQHEKYVEIIIRELTICMT